MTGLATTFNIQNGRFTLTSGLEMTRDEVNFYCHFDKNRTYLSEYGKNSVTLLRSLEQKPISYIQSNSTILLGTLQQELQKYVPNISIRSIDIGYFVEDRKHFHIMIEYSSKQENKTEIEDVTFV